MTNWDGPWISGNLLVQQHWIPGDDVISSSTFMQQNYGYDALNRIDWLGEYHEGATNTGSQAYSYDRYGNRTISSAFGTSINNKQFTVVTAYNQLGVPVGQSGVMTYDASGNLTKDTYSGLGVTRVYDAENRMTSETQANNYVAGVYTYNADGQRVRRKVDGVETWQVYGMDGELLAEYAASGAPASPQKEYGYRNGEMLVTAEPAACSQVARHGSNGARRASSQIASAHSPPSSAMTICRSERSSMPAAVAAPPHKVTPATMCASSSLQRRETTRQGLIISAQDTTRARRAGSQV